MFNKKGLGWGIDLFIGLMILTAGITSFYFFITNLSSFNEDEFYQLFHEAEILIESILSEGHPVYWNLSNVKFIGLLNNGKINHTKLEFFHNMTQEDYKHTKNLFKTNYDFYFLLDEEIYINSILIEGIGKPGTNKNSIIQEAENLVIKKQITIYKNKPTVAYLYVWKNG